MVDDAQLSLWVANGTQIGTGLKPPTFRSEGKSTNQYTTISFILSNHIYRIDIIWTPGFYFSKKVFDLWLSHEKLSLVIQLPRRLPAYVPN